MTRTLPPRKTKHYHAGVLEADIRQWKGTPAIGLEVAKAKQHADVLYREFYKRPASDIHGVDSEIFAVCCDPRVAPRNEQVRQAWAKLPFAIEAANAASQHIMLAYAPSDANATRFLFHSEQLLHSLLEAERQLEE